MAVFFLATSYWLQVWKIHVHKEVRDISAWTYIFLLCGYCFLLIKASYDWFHGNGYAVWIVRQIATIIPVVIVLFQIKIHARDHWHEDDDPLCAGCGCELEKEWIYCPYCSLKSPDYIEK